MQEIAVIFERTIYAMHLGTIAARLGSEEYVVTLPAELPKDRLKATIATVMRSLEALAEKNRDHELRPADTWSYKIAPVRFPMLAYPTDAPTPADLSARVELPAADDLEGELILHDQDELPDPESDALDGYTEDELRERLPEYMRTDK